MVVRVQGLNIRAVRRKRAWLPAWVRDPGRPLESRPYGQQQRITHSRTTAGPSA